MKYEICIIAMLALSTGCSLVPNDKSVSFHQHVASRDDGNVQKLAERRDNAEFLAAHQRFEQQDIAGCKEQLEFLLARNPQHCDARLLMADVLLSTRQPQAALAQVKEALKYHADNPDVHYAMGLTLDATGRTDEALTYYETATKKAPSNEAYAISYRTALEAAQRRKSPSAQTLPPSKPAISTINFASGTTATSLKPVLAASSAKPAPAGATVAYDGVTGAGFATTDATPSASAASFAADVATFDDDVAKPARPTAQVSSPNNPQDPQTAVAEAAEALKRHDAKRALVILTPAARRFPPAPEVFRSLAIAHLETGDYSAARKDLERSLSLDKSSALSYFLMGCTLTKLGQAEAAAAEFRRAAALDPRYGVHP